MNIDEIEVGTKWKDCLGKAKYSKNGELVKGRLERLERLVTITNKTSNSIEYKDTSGFISWVTLEEFIRIENSTKEARFSKVN